MEGAKAGYITYRILELTDRLHVGFRLWRAAPNAQTRAWIEQRIVNDAGILGHYVADGSNPHHTTIHHNGWVGENPKGYTTDRRFHGRFEANYVQAHLKLGDFAGLVGRSPRRLGELRPAVQGYLQRSHAQLERLYELDRAEAFGPDTKGTDHKRFTAERLAAGAEMLRDLWWTAWVTSE